MKSLIQNGCQFLAAILSLLVIVYCIGISSVQAAGSASKSITKAGSEQTTREKANDYFKKAEKYQASWNYKDAIKTYGKAVKIDPEYAEAHSNLGYCYRKDMQYDKAISSYKRAIQLDPKLAEAHEYIGEAYAELEEFDLAEQHLQILKDLDAEHASELEMFINQMRQKS